MGSKINNLGLWGTLFPSKSAVEHSGIGELGLY